MPYLGKHLICEYYGCARASLDKVSFIQEQMHEAALIAGATIIDESFHTFEPHGVSGVIVIAESHLTIHTWPEYGYAAADIFICGDELQPERAAEHLKVALGAERYTVEIVRRGVFDEATHPELPHKPSLRKDAHRESH